MSRLLEIERTVSTAHPSTGHGDRPRPQKLSAADVEAMFVRLHESRDRAVRDTLVLAHRHLAAYFARRFRDRGEPLEDLIQVAEVGLINAVNRYDPHRGVRFGTYAAATIIGELRRYFRDKVWAIHIPRRHRELNYRLMQAVEVLRQTLGRSPTIEELAQHTGIPFDVAIEALEASHAYAPASLDEEASDRGQDDTVQRVEQLGADDPAIARTDDMLALRDAWKQLSGCEQRVLTLRFREGLPQGRVAERVHVSQMQVSRIQRRALMRLRELMSD
jgi:RNA polymerase sigma-B factor